MDWKNYKFLLIISSILILVSLIGMILPSTTYTLKDSDIRTSYRWGFYGDPSGDYALAVTDVSVTLYKYDLSEQVIFRSQYFDRYSVPTWSEDGNYIVVKAGPTVYVLDAHDLSKISEIYTARDLKMSNYDQTVAFYLDNGLNLYFVSNYTSVSHYNIASHELTHDFDMNLTDNVYRALFLPGGKSVLLDIYHSFVVYDFSTNSTRVLLDNRESTGFRFMKFSASWNIFQMAYDGSYHTFDLRKTNNPVLNSTDFRSISFDDSRYLTLQVSETEGGSRLRNVRWSIGELENDHLISKATYNKGPLYDLVNEGNYEAYRYNYYWFSKHNTLLYLGHEQSLEFQLSNKAVNISKFADFAVILNGFAFVMLFFIFLYTNGLIDFSLLGKKNTESDLLRKDWLHYYKLMIIAAIFSIFHIIEIAGNNGNLKTINYIFASATVYLDIVVVFSLIQMSNALYNPDSRTLQKSRIELGIWVFTSLIIKYFTGIGFGLIPWFPLNQLLVVGVWINTIVFIDLLTTITVRIMDSKQGYSKSYFAKISLLSLINAFLYSVLMLK